MSEHKYQGLFFEEFKIGTKFVSSARTITETDIVNFAGISGDYNQIHTDVEFSKTHPFGQRVAHGLLVTSIASGLVAMSGLLEGTIIAFREISNWKFSNPTFIGDTVHVITEVINTKQLPRSVGGMVEILLKVKNQKDETVMKGKWIAVMANRPD